MPILYRFILSFSFLFFFTHAHAAESLEKIVLQLPWHHQFQFAGYYAAVEQGYYKEAGFDVILKSGRPGLSAIEEVVSGRAEYGVARSELLLHRLKGEPVVALAAVFQQSAVIMLARQDSGIKSPQDMIGRRVMLLEGDNAAEYIATFQRAEITIDQLAVIPSSFDIQDLIHGKTDVFNAYITNEPFLLEEQGIPYTVIKPSDYAIEFYGDTLFTSEEELGSHPDHVKAFLAASMRGWEYALSHHEEIIELLVSEYEVNKSKSHLRYEANAVGQLIMADLVEIGHMLSQRWQNMADVFVRLDMADPGYSLDGFLYDPPLEPDYTKIRRWATFAAAFFILSFVIVILYFNKRLHRELEKRTRESKRSEALFRETFNNMRTGVAIYEAVDDGNDFLFKDLNPSGCSQGQVERANILGKSVKEIFPGIVDLGLFDVFQRVWQTGKPELQPSSVYKDKRIELWVENYIYKLPSGEIVAVYDDITKKKELQRKQVFSQKRLETLWKLSSMLDTDLKGICDAVLEEIVDMTESQYGFFGFMDDNEQILKLHSWSKEAMADCALSHEPMDFPIEGSGIWGNAIRDRRPFILNDYQQDCPNKKGTPDGHVTLTRIMSIPVLISGKVVAMAAVANKGSDYSDDDRSQIVAFLTNAQIILERKQKELAIIQAKEEWQKSFDAIPDIVTIQDKDMRIVRANKAAHSFFEAQPGGLNGQPCYKVFRDISGPCPECPMLETIKDTASNSETILHKNLGKTFLVSSAAIDDSNGDTEYLVHIAKDITEQKRLEEELFQAHKMEAVGTLAGGIAHDFNNILSAIIGFTELAKSQVDEESEVAAELNEVLGASKRATGLVKQILTISRKGGSQERKALQPYLIVKEALKLMRASLPTTIDIQADIDPKSGSTLAGPTNVHQIVVNLCTNALHAMEEETGVIKITLRSREVSADEIPENYDMVAGPFIELSVSDTGCGMDKQIRQRIFEPYFTTKEVGKGTGLGLSVVLGIVQDLKGMITVESELGKGTTFHVYFPKIQEEKTPVHVEAKEPLQGGTERILIVDDESLIVAFQEATLSHLGYTVTAKTSSEEALAAFKNTPNDFDLLITDQTMPKLSGANLAKEVLSLQTDMPIIVCTGYSTTLTEERAMDIGIKKYLNKPVERETLARIVRSVLDQK